MFCLHNLSFTSLKSLQSNYRCFHLIFTERLPAFNLEFFFNIFLMLFEIVWYSTRYLKNSVSVILCTSLYLSWRQVGSWMLGIFCIFKVSWVVHGLVFMLFWTYWKKALKQEMGLQQFRNLLILQNSVIRYSAYFLSTSSERL